MSELSIEMLDSDKEIPGQSSIALVQDTLTEFEKVASGLAELNTKYKGVVFAVATTKGMAEAKAARMAVREPRYAVDKAAKAAKDPLNALKRDIDARAKQITESLMALEQPIHQQIEVEETRKAAEKAERERMESERIAAITKRIADIQGYVNLALECRTAERVQGLLDKLRAIEVNADTFDEFWPEAESVQITAIGRLKDIVVRKQVEESERARIKEEQEAEAARLKAEREAIEAERLASAAVLLAYQAQREAFEAEQAAARAALEADQKRMEEERAELDRRKEDALLIAETIDLPEVFFNESPEPVESNPYEGELLDEEFRPQDIEIVDAVAEAFAVSYETSLSWLERLDFKKLRS